MFGSIIKIVIIHDTSREGICACAEADSSNHGTAVYGQRGRYPMEGTLVKKIVSFGMLALFILVPFTSGYAATQITLIVNGHEVNSAEVRVIDNTTYVPLRITAGLLGSDVNWNSNTKTITIQPKGYKPIDSYVVDEFVITQFKMEKSDHYLVITFEIANTGKEDYEVVDLKMDFYNHESNTSTILTTQVWWLRAGDQQLVQVELNRDDLDRHDLVKFSVDSRYNPNILPNQPIDAETKYLLIVNGKVAMNANVKIINNTTYVPLRVTAELLGSAVNWDPKTKTITIQPGKKKTVDRYIAEEFAFTHLKVESNSKNTLVSVEIVNGGKTEYQSIDIGMAFYDLAGNRIAGAVTSEYWIIPGVQKLVQVFFAGIDLSDYDSIRLSVDRRFTGGVSES